MAIGLFTLSNPLLAQQSTPKNPSGREAYEASRARERNQRDREMRMQHIDDATKASTKKEQLLALTQIKEDFERMQAVNNDLMRAVSKDQALDYRRISEATREINTRAKRLKTNLIFPETEEVKKEQPPQSSLDGANLQASLQKLDDLVMSFVTNPHFQNLGVVDTQNAARAKRDLKVIIELSNNIRKSAEKLGKSSEKP